MFRNKMKYSFLALSIIVFTSNSCLVQSSSLGRGINGGIPCVACTTVIGVLEQVAIVRNTSVSAAFKQVCSYLQEGPYKQGCRDLFNFFAPVVLELLYRHETADVICHAAGLCFTEKGQQQCNLYPLPQGEGDIVKRLDQQYPGWRKKFRVMDSSIDVCKIPGIHFICDLYDTIYGNRKPLTDFDQDGFSPMETFQGSDWRGRDCDDTKSNIHPGAKPINDDREVDHNCNGIYGTNSDSGESYEKEFCEGTDQKGIIILGDSAGAHFHIPVQWTDPTLLNKEVLTHLAHVVTNSFDWPMMSPMTGYKNVTWPISPGAVHSIYDNLRTRNRCNHRDYQNLCVNGASSFDMMSQAKRISRNQTSDHPVFLVIELLGNDVCNHYPDTVKHMTTSYEMRNNLLNLLLYLDGILPAGSHIMMNGMTDGRVLYNALHERYHPVGRLKKDVTYADFYDYFNCMQVNPCTGWMNTDEKLRNITTERALELDKVMQDIAKQYARKFKNFELRYKAFPLDRVEKYWIKKHGPGTMWQILEPVDGFHPNQYAETLTAGFVWSDLLNEWPEALGGENQANEKIQEIFRDQGGY